MLNMKTIRLGIIGTGVAARILHWPALKKLKDKYEIRAVTNRTVSKAKEFADLIGLERKNVYGDYRLLLEREDVDAVVLALPPKLNYSTAVDSFEAGKHVICEKPIAPSVKVAEQIVELPKKYDKKLLIAENFRYEKAVSETKKMLDDGVISSPFMMIYKWMQHVPLDDEIANRPWRGDSGLPGGFLGDHGIHMIDVVRYLIGEIDAIQVFGNELADHVTGIDTALYNMRSVSGTLCTIQWSFAAPFNDISHIELWADNGCIKLNMDRIEVITTSGKKIIEMGDVHSSFYYEFLDFYEAIAHDKEPKMGLNDGLMDLKIVEKAYESISTGKSIYIDGGEKIK